MYLCGVNTDVNCIIVQSLYLITGVLTGVADKLSFLPVVVDQLLYIALPFAYKRIVTTKVVAMTISILWLVTACVPIVTAINQPLLYQPAIGDCLRVTNQIQAFPIIQWITVLVLLPLQDLQIKQPYDHITQTKGNHCRKLLEKF